jgi:hypothetical protein
LSAIEGVRFLGESCLPDCQPACGTQRYTTIVRADEDELTQAIVALASQYGQYGYVGSSHCWMMIGGT